MSYRNSQLALTNSSDALFRAWINEIHNSLIAFGWTQTADTGQINFSTVTRPTSTNTYQGYAIYQAGDSLQATAPIYMKLEFGTGATNTDVPGMKVTVGMTGTNGSGTLTGVTIQAGDGRIQADTASGTAINCRTAGSSSSFRCNMWSALTKGMGFAIERDLNYAGVEQGTGVNFLSFNVRDGNNFQCWSQFLGVNGDLGSQESKWYALVSGQSTQAAGGYLGVGAVRTVMGTFRNPMKTILVYARTDIANETINPVSIYGATHNFLFLRIDGANVSRSINTWNGDCAMAMLWE